MVCAVALAIPARVPARVLGTSGSAPVSCPTDCLVEARVSGFQTSIGRHGKLFLAPGRGKIVSWSIDLGMPRRVDIKGFNRKFGESEARLAILKRVREKRHGRVKYVLLRESHVERLRGWFGHTASFALDRPLKIGPGQIVALTIPTWAPAFAVDHSRNSRWRASRRKTSRRGGCVTRDGFANIAAGSAQQRLGSRRTYGCGYWGTRLLYSATFVKTAVGG